MEKPLARVVDLVSPQNQQLAGLSLDEARSRVLSAEPAAMLGLQGSFALVARDSENGERVCLARSLDRPLRYFLAKEVAGPMLVVAERIDEIRDFLDAEGYADQFHPTYTRMVPAHHVTTLQLVGCPDPNPVYQRFFTPPRGVAAADLDELGQRYVGALRDELQHWVATVPETEPLGVLFSGGGDSGAVLLVLEHVLLSLGQSPARLKVFTLAVLAGDGAPSENSTASPVSAGPDSPSDLLQARDFLRRVGREHYLEVISVAADRLNPLAAVEVIEDYKPLDVEAATMLLALLDGLRQRYPEWRHLVDGDGGDENLKDYPIEENRELTIRSVVNNSMLYQEGWGVGAIKHSLTFSGGFSRGCVRTYAPLSRHGFAGFSPYTRPAVIEAAEAIPFDALTRGSHEKLYALKGEILRRGIAAICGVDMPIYEKCRFQHGAASEAVRSTTFDPDLDAYRRHFLRHFTGAS